MELTIQITCHSIAITVFSLPVSGGVYPHNPQYYRTAVAVLRSRWGEDCEVVVLSDDMAWCRDNLRNRDNYTADITIRRRNVADASSLMS